MRSKRSRSRIRGQQPVSRRELQKNQTSTETTLDKPLFTYCLGPESRGKRRLIGLPTACTRLSRMPATILDGFKAGGAVELGMVEPPRKVLPLPPPPAPPEVEDPKLVIRRP